MDVGGEEREKTREKEAWDEPAKPTNLSMLESSSRQVKRVRTDIRVKDLSSSGVDHII